jgi:hypothetical protein
VSVQLAIAAISWSVRIIAPDNDSERIPLECHRRENVHLLEDMARHGD